MKKPVSVMWESTIACGLKCKHCKASAKKNPDPRELTTDEGKKLIDQMAAFGRPYPILRITGGNALMRSDIFDLIAYAKDSGITVTIAPSTTPQMNRENITKLKEAGCDVVALSIDGATADAHDRFRGVPGTFDHLTRACEIMNEVGLPFRLLTTVTKFNVLELPDVLKVAHDLGAAGFYFYMLIPTGRAKEEYEITPPEYEDVFNFIYDLMQNPPMTVNAIAGCEPYRRVAVMRRLIENGELGEEIFNFGELYYHLKDKLDEVLSTMGSSEDIKPSAYKTRGKDFGKGIFVSHIGHVYPSSFLPLEIGDVRKSELGDIYNSSTELEDMQDSAKLKGRCGVCEFNDICRGSRSRAYAVTGDFLAEDPSCIYRPGTVGEIADNREVLKELQVTNYSKTTK